MTDIKFYEHHAQDARVRLIRDDVAQTIGASNANSVGVSGNNPIVLRVCIAKGAKRSEYGGAG